MIQQWLSTEDNFLVKIGHLTASSKSQSEIHFEKMTQNIQEVLEPDVQLDQAEEIEILDTDIMGAFITFLERNVTGSNDLK